MHLVLVHLQLLDRLCTSRTRSCTWLNRWVPQDAATGDVVHARAAKHIARRPFHAGAPTDVMPETPFHTLDTANSNLTALCDVAA